MKRTLLVLTALLLSSVAWGQKMNPFFSKIALLHASIGGERTQKKDKSCDLSCLVAGRGLEPLTSGL